MQVVILAGGLGTRLRPLTYKIPKAMVSIKGKPFLEYILELLKNNNLKNIIICAGYLGEKIKDYFQNGEKIGMRILYSFEKELLGTGGALKNAENLLENEFLVLNGDTFLDINYQDLITDFHNQNKLGMIVVFKNQPKIVQNNITLNDKKEVINYDKKNEGEATCVDAGVQVFKKDILEMIQPGKVVSLEEEVWPILIQRKQLTAYLTNQRFYDIGTFEQLREINQII